jgi:hypothetical protein
VKKILSAIAIGALALGLVACGGDGEPKSSTAKQENQASEDALNQYLKAQPVPQFTWSQLRQNLIELQTAQASTTATTSFFFNVGIADPIMECPSIGFAIPATYQLTNPQQAIEVDTSGTDADSAVTIGQLEATGVYTADTTGTYAICVNDEGEGYAFYWEGFISTVSGPATWDPETKRIVLTGSPSAEFSTAED